VRVVNLDTDFSLKALFYGAPGSEKTRLSASAALDLRTAPALMISASGNPLSIRDYEKKPTIVELGEYRDLTAIHKWLAADQPTNTKMWANLGRPVEKFKSVVVDGLTYIQRWAALEAAGNLQMGVGEVPLAMTQQHHGEVLTRMNILADRFYSLDMHVIFTALEYEQQDGLGNLSYRVQMTGQAAGEFPSYAYIVGRLIHRQRISNRSVGTQMKTMLEERLKRDTDATSVLMLRPSTRYYAKNQYCKGPAIIVNPTITKILDMIGGVELPIEQEEAELEEAELAGVAAGTLGQG
jgi:hypothetical protein